MADGSVKIDVGLNIGKAEKDLAKLKEKIMKAEDALNANSARKTELEKRLEELGNTAEASRKKIQRLREEYNNSRGGERASIKAQIDRYTGNYNATVKDIDALSREYQKVDENIEKGTKDLEEMKQHAGDMAKQIEAARPGEALANSFETAKKSLAKFLKYSLGIRSVYILFQRLKSAVKDAVQEYAQYDKELKYNLSLMDATKKAIQVTQGAAMAGVYTAILPVVQKIANGMLEASNAAAKFIAIVSGKESYKRAVVNTNEVAASLENTSDAADNVADSAKEAKKQLMGFDELNILAGEDKTSSASGKTAVKSALDGIDIIEEKLDGLDDSFLTKLALSVKDVLFDWTDLNPEQIAEKAIVGLTGLMGGIAGFMIGGVPGAIIGTLTGVAIGLIIDSAIFDHDGKLSRSEVQKMLRGVLVAFLGGVLGFTLGGPGGALIGATISLGIWGVITALELYGNNAKKSEFQTQIDALKEEVKQTLQTDADLRVRINSITGEIDDNTIADFAAAQALIDSIFTLDAKENKTTEEAALLKSQIEALNGLGLDGINLQFDDVTQRVVGTREQVQGLLDDLLKQYQLEAMKEAYVESFKAQYESTENVKKATGEATQAASDYEAALQQLTKAQEDYNREYDIFYNQSYGFGDRSGLSAAEDALKDANDAVKAAKENADGAKEALENAIETAELASEKVDTIGKALADGYSEGIKENRDKSADEARIMAEKTLDAISTTLDAHSPSRKTAEQGKNAVDGFKNEIEAGTPSVVGAAKSMMEQVIREYADGVKRLLRVMNFTWSIPRPKIPQIGWQMQNFRYGNQQMSIPQFFVNWYARGGIFDRASLIGVGEAGKEAVVPLEKNTGWMQMVADGLMERMEQSRFAEQLAEAFVTVPRPAMASGSVVPPRAVTDYSPSVGIEDAVRRGVYDALSISSSGGQGEERQPINVYIGDEKIASYILRVNSRNSLITGGR